MGLIPQAKCSRCDRLYSGLRTRCPYCGARRRKRGKRTEDTGTATWKLVIGIMLLVILIAGVIVIMVNTFSKPETETEQPPETQLVENEGVNSVVGEPVEPTTEPEPEPEPEIIISKAEKVSIYYGTREKTDVTMKVSETLQFKAVTVPAEIESAPLWESSNNDVIVVLQSGLVTAVGRGTATLVVTVDGVSASCIIRVK